MTLHDFLERIERKAPPAPADKLARLEETLGAKLPDDYRDFLLACNGGYVGGALWYKGPTPEGEAADTGVHHVCGFREESSISLEWALECYEDRIPGDLLKIMDDPFGNAICLGLRGPHFGRIYFWDHEEEPDTDEWDGEVETAGNIDLIAGSFTDFVAGLDPVDTGQSGDPEKSIDTPERKGEEADSSTTASPIQLLRKLSDFMLGRRNRSTSGPRNDESKPDLTLWKPERITTEIRVDDSPLKRGKYLYLEQKLDPGEYGWSMSKISIPDSWTVLDVFFRDKNLILQVGGLGEFQINASNKGTLDYHILCASKGGGKVSDEELEQLWNGYARNI